MNEKKPASSPFKYERADDSAGFLLWKLTSLWQQTLGEIFGALELTQTQYAILASLRWFEEQQQTVTQKQLAEHARIEPMTLSKAIRKLEDAELVSREQSEGDSRAVVVGLSARGRRLTQKAIVAIEQADDDFFGKLGRSQLDTYKSLTAHLIERNSK